MKLNVLQWRDLALFLDRIPQKELPTTADVRKCVGAVEQIREGIDKQAKEYEKLYQEANLITVPASKKIAKLREGLSEAEIKESKEIQKIVDKSNADLKPINEKLNKLDLKYSKEEAELDLKDDYKGFIKDHWETHLRKQYDNTKAMVKVAEAFEI